MGASSPVSTSSARCADERGGRGSRRERYPGTNQFKSATVETYASMGAAGRPETRRVISVLLSPAGTVLLVVCLNISGHDAGRGVTRERELSIRARRSGRAGND